MKISDVLEEVAHGYESGIYRGYSCDVLKLYSSLGIITHTEQDVMFDGLRQMGLEPMCIKQFKGVKNKQKARMMWLTWAAMMAREQGL